MNRWRSRLAELQNDIEEALPVQNVQNVQKSDRAVGFEHFEQFEQRRGLVPARPSPGPTPRKNGPPLRSMTAVHRGLGLRLWRGLIRTNHRAMCPRGVGCASLTTAVAS